MLRAAAPEGRTENFWLYPLVYPGDENFSTNPEPPVSMARSVKVERSPWRTDDLEPVSVAFTLGIATRDTLTTGKPEARWRVLPPRSTICRTGCCAKDDAAVSLPGVQTTLIMFGRPGESLIVKASLVAPVTRFDSDTKLSM